jgi:hypothetical protein
MRRRCAFGQSRPIGFELHRLMVAHRSMPKKHRLGENSAFLAGFCAYFGWRFAPGLVHLNLRNRGSVAVLAG